MTKLILIRHAEALGNITRRFQGQIDADITENGTRQLEKLGEKMKDTPIDIIYSSDLMRAQKTAQAVRGDRNIDIIIEKKLREIDGGDWEDVPFEDLPEKWSAEYDVWCHDPANHQMPGGESMRDVEKRMVEAIGEIVDQNKGKTVCITSHGTALKVFMTVARGWELERINNVMWYENTAVTCIDVDDDGVFDIVTEGDDSHLPDELATLKKQTWWKDTQ